AREFCDYRTGFSGIASREGGGKAGTHTTFQGRGELIGKWWVSPLFCPHFSALTFLFASGGREMVRGRGWGKRPPFGGLMFGGRGAGWRQRIDGRVSGRRGGGSAADAGRAPVAAQSDRDAGRPGQRLGLSRGCGDRGSGGQGPGGQSAAAGRR